jgi:hypothetical protein
VKVAFRCCRHSFKIKIQLSVMIKVDEETSKVEFQFSLMRVLELIPRKSFAKNFERRYQRNANWSMEGQPSLKLPCSMQRLFVW